MDRDPKRAGILILHGIGRQKASYADPFMRDLRVRLEQSAIQSCSVVMEAVHYADVFDDIQKRRVPPMIETSYWWQIFSRFARWLLGYVLSDAVSYEGDVRFGGGGYLRIQGIVSDSLKTLQGQLLPNASVIIVAHSLGAMVISDYIYDRQQGKNADKAFEGFANLKALVTFGCNIPLFEMGHVKTVPIKRPKTDNGDPEFAWTNFYSPFDILGYRLVPYYDVDPDFALSDVKHFAGGLLTAWNLFSHIGYWRSSRVQKHIVDLLESLIVDDVVAPQDGSGNG